MVRARHRDLEEQPFSLDEGNLPSRSEAQGSDDLVDLYLNEIGRIPRVTPEEEIHLARRIQAKLGIDAAREELLVMRLGRPSAEEDVAAFIGCDPKALIEATRQGLWAQRKLINANLRLVVSIAKKYIGRNVPFLDLIQEGNIGLMRATEKFDPEKGYRFSTYATWWIRQSITRAIANQARTIRLPIHMVEKVRKVRREMRMATLELGRRPSEDELASRLAIKVKKLRTIQEVSRQPVSLDMPVGSEGDISLGEMIEDGTAERPFDELVQKALASELYAAMNVLKPVEREVLALRFGLKGEEALTLREVGERFDLTRERIRQIESEALRKLRRSKRKQILEQYVGR
ncbi:RpoD/SigA family RNA polymerase sigma factor [Gloeobacter morelensis]|uniref:RpoD/SigA family RNA polymerase sigma factor n=1 Tax=Gloeobacter morelensis MG652769 TaxID=2781736 RepID=A0ABY3PQ06_9CYAN|nr:RpoD/SigA family RNA polymerase sigma factor [Gloeobacter morelensis]UFP95788.1 RpoD/SigA family RNA polymerase sigma factor [Gloeobacter morelensis MG652769]